ncbi:conserved Plasmodium protein, unknown function [Plasmodium ovale wallikeri]|uniref:Phosphoglycerate mutase n=1 Tax=Plasmodium ovale wallikeri TaxID=864142 RepID=A0A1A8ZR36_PLAOA|nr:conserved Plasmodium protein, unknown function [Plasmodium ovale wallikeri]SBT46808.1 conserved Plasmodium protein, unknown function [Plasmodium ovale wallikeri]
MYFYIDFIGSPNWYNGKTVNKNINYGYTDSENWEGGKKENVRVKTIYFVRHSESIWNSVVNKEFSVKTFLNGCLVLLYEIFFLFSKKSVIVDSPLSNCGVIQSIELSNFLQQGNQHNENDLCVVSIGQENNIERDTHDSEKNGTIEMEDLRRCGSSEDAILANPSKEGGSAADGSRVGGSAADGSRVGGSAAGGSRVGGSAADGSSVVENKNTRVTRSSNDGKNKLDEENGEGGNQSKVRQRRGKKEENVNHITNNRSSNTKSIDIPNGKYQQGSYNHKEVINLSIREHIDVLNSNNVMYSSTILCSDLRRAISSCFISFYNRVNKNNEPIYILNSLQEISRNPDCVSLFPFHKYKYITTDIEDFLHKDVEKLCKKNIIYTNNFSKNKFIDTLSYVFNNDSNIFIIFGHSLWFRLFFNYFLKQPHKAKTNKIKNSGIIVFNMMSYYQGGNIKYEIEPDSVRAHNLHPSTANQPTKSSAKAAKGDGER